MGRRKPGGWQSPEEREPLSAVLFLSAILLLNFSSRTMLAPLLPVVEADLGLTHAGAGTLFLLISLGYSPAMLLSGFVARPLTHRGTILLSALLVGLALLAISLSASLAFLRFGLVLLGVGAGLYMPSGVASVTSLAGTRDWGKALALHELGPNLGLIVTPFLAQVLLQFMEWRRVMAVLAAANLAVGLLFLFFGRGGRFPGEVPRLGNVRRILALPAFWVIGLLFCLAAGASLGIYAVLATYLVSERGMEPGLVNTLIGFSRVSGLVLALVSGWLVDRFGVKRLLAGVCALTGLFTVLLGLSRGTGLLVMVFLQPMVIAAFFPAAFVSFAGVAPPRLRNVGISLVLPVAFLFGAGVVPSVLGLFGTYGSFTTGFILIGLLLLAGLLPIALLRFEATGAKGPDPD